MDNSGIVTNAALALWTSCKPREELAKIGFMQVDAASLELKDICLIADFQNNTLAFGRVKCLKDKQVVFFDYEEIDGETAISVQFPKKNIMVHKLDSSVEDHEISCLMTPSK